MAPERAPNRGTEDLVVCWLFGSTPSDVGFVPGDPMIRKLTLLLAMQGETISVDQMAICGAGE